MKIRIGDVVGGCFVSVWLLVIGLYGLNALLGVITGELYLPSKKGGGGTLHGAWARIISLVILAVSYFILSAMWKGVRKGRKRRQKPDPTWEFQGDETDGSGDDEGGAS